MSLSFSAIANPDIFNHLCSVVGSSPQASPEARGKVFLGFPEVGQLAFRGGHLALVFAPFTNRSFQGTHQLFEN